jgi:hypothetical protein
MMSGIITRRVATPKSIGKDEILVAILGKTSETRWGPVTPFVAFWWRVPPCRDAWAEKWYAEHGIDAHVSGQVFYANLDEYVGKWRAEGKVISYQETEPVPRKR